MGDVEGGWAQTGSGVDEVDPAGVAVVEENFEFPHRL